MLDLDQYSCLGAALRDALDRWPNETCLIEADREREKTRLTYSDFKEMALPLARALQDAEFEPGDRAAIIMTNQSKWLISAYAIFYCGGVLVPLDYKLTRGGAIAVAGALQGKGSGGRILTCGAQLSQSPEFKNSQAKGAGDGSAAGSGPGGRVSLGRISAQGRASILCRGSAKMRPASCIPPARAGRPRDAYSLTKIIWSSASR